MPRYAAFLRGVMPMNPKIADLKEAFESACLTDLNTVLGSGNGVFSGRRSRLQCSKCRAEVVPLGLLLTQEGDESRFFADVVQEGITREQRIARHPTVGYAAQPVHSRIGLLQQGIRESDVVGGVMKVDVSLSSINADLDVLLEP